MAFKTDIEIAQEASLQPINAIAASLGIPDDAVENYGRYKAKLDLHALKDLPEKGKLILVTAITPTPAGEGKTTTSVGLTDGLRKIGKNAVVGARPEDIVDKDKWGIAVIGDNLKIGAGAKVAPKEMIAKDIEGVE